MDYPTFLVASDEEFNIIEFANMCERTYIDYEILFATKNKVEEIKNVKQFETKEQNVDKIINTLLPLAKGNKVVVIRRYTGNFEDVKKLVSSVKKDTQIAKIKEKHSKVLDFFKKMLDLVINFIFGYKLFHTSLAMICFGSVAVDVLKTLPNCSTYTKVNKWSGIEIVEVPIFCKKKIKFKPHILGNIIKLCICLLFLVASILCWALIEYSSSAFYLKALYILVITISFTIMAVETIIICIKYLVGDNEYGKISIE